jgi:hypothetical protein
MNIIRILSFYLRTVRICRLVLRAVWQYINLAIVKTYSVCINIQLPVLQTKPRTSRQGFTVERDIVSVNRYMTINIQSNLY